MMIGVSRSAIVRTIVVIHIALFLVFFVFDESTFSQSELGKFYRSKIIIGPFFREDRILSAPHVMMRYHTSSGWSDWTDVGMNYKKNYDARFWHYGSIMKSEYVLHLALGLARAGQKDSVQLVEGNRYFGALHRFIEEEKLLNSQADSVRLMYGQRYIDANEGSEMDTVWQFVYDVKPMHDRLFE